MSETQTIQFSHEYTDSAATHEPLTNDRLGGLLAGVGNHEAKALLFSAMEPGVAYGYTDLEHLYIGMQGDQPAHLPHNNGPMQYCQYSFEPIGAVAKVSHGYKGLHYELTEEGETVGKAVAGHMLAYSLRHPEVSLKQVLGMTVGNDPTLRSPMRRIEVLADLLTRPESASVTEVGKELSQKTHDAAYHIKAMAKEGLLTIDELSDESVDTVFGIGEVSADQFVPGERERGLAAKTIEIISDLQIEEVPITRAVLTERILSIPKYADSGVTRLNRRLGIVFAQLTKQGIISEQPRTVSRRQALVSVNPDHLAALQELVTLVDDLSNADPAFLEEGRRLAAHILADSSQTKQLVAKAMANSPQARGLPLGKRISMVSNFLEENGTATTSQLSTSLKEKGLTRLSARHTLRHMQALGTVKNAIQKSVDNRGRVEKVWTLNADEETTSTD